MVRRFFLSRFAQFAALPLALGGSSLGQTPHKTLKIMMKSAWGSDDPTKAAFPFLHGLALAEAGHEVQIFLLGEAVGLMRKTLANAVTPVGWPAVGETLDKRHPGGEIGEALPREGSAKQRLQNPRRLRDRLCLAGQVTD